MKKLLCFIITMSLLLSSTSIAYAKNGRGDQKNDHKTYWQYPGNHNIGKKHEFKYSSCSWIKYHKYKFPTSPVTKGMEAKVTFNEDTAVLKIVKDSTSIEIDFKNKTVKVNGVIDNNSGIFSAKYKDRATVMINYIAKILGVGTCFDKDKIIIQVPGLDNPTKVTVTPFGNLVQKNTLNSTNQYMTASAKIKAGQATGGKAELYVGSKLVATDHDIKAGDTSVTFTTSDNTPTNSELQAAVPKGGVVAVKLYNAKNYSVTSKAGNPKLTVDYAIPTISGINSASFDLGKGKLYLNVNGAGAVGDKVNVTKLSFYDAALGRGYQLTENPRTGSVGTVKNSNTLEITLGSADKNGLSGFGSSTLFLNIAAGALLKDAAGNTSAGLTEAKTIQISAASGTLEAPTAVTVTPVGGTVKANTLNTTNLFMTATAKIKAGQAAGGRAELYVGSKLVCVDANINASDTTVDFVVADNSPTNAELQALVPQGGVVYVKLFNANKQSVTSNTGNPNLTVDYSAPVLTGISSAILNLAGNQLYITVSGAGTAGDMVDVTKLSLYDASLGRSCQLTNATGTGSTGFISGSTTLVINLGSLDKQALKDFGKTTVILNIASGSLLKDSAGNTSSNLSSIQNIPVTVIK